MFPPRPLARTSRRSLLRGGAAGAVGLAALGLGVPRLPGSAPQTASAQTGPWAGGDVPLASRSNRQMAAAARAFLDRLGADQLGSAWYPDPTDPARTKWRNVPARAPPPPA